MSNVDMGVTPTVVPFQGSFNPSKIRDPSKIRELIAWTANAEKQLADFYFGEVVELEAKAEALREAEAQYNNEVRLTAGSADSITSALRHSLPRNVDRSWVGETPSWYVALQRVETSLGIVSSLYWGDNDGSDRDVLFETEQVFRLVGDLECELSGIAQEVNRE